MAMMDDICVCFNHQPSGWEHKFTFFTPERYSADQTSGLPATNDIMPQGTYSECGIYVNFGVPAYGSVFCSICLCVYVLYIAYLCGFLRVVLCMIVEICLDVLSNVTESDMLNFEMRTRTLGRRRGTTVIRQEEEEVDCNTRIVQEGNRTTSFYVYIHQLVCMLFVKNVMLWYRWSRCASGEVE